MNGRDVIAIARRSPFRPFVIETVGGTSYAVRHPDMVATFAPESRTGSTTVVVAQESGPDVLSNTLTIDRIVLLANREELAAW